MKEIDNTDWILYCMHLCHIDTTNVKIEKRRYMTYKDVRSFLVRKMEEALKRNWINRADKIAEILVKLTELMPKIEENPYLPEDYKERMKKFMK